MPRPSKEHIREIDQIRQFNRFYTQSIGVLEEGLLKSEFSLTEVRILYELSHGERLSAVTLSESLRLDAGYLSRILSRLEEAGLIERVRSSQDARQSDISLTAHGRKTFEPLERRSRELIAELIQPLNSGERQRLVGAMAQITGLLDRREHGQRPSAVVLRPAGIGDIGWVIHRQALLYANEFGWNQEFEALLAEIGAQFIRKFKPARERAWVAEYQGRVVGSVFLVRKSKEVGQLRLLYVESDARGLGIGAQLVDECLRSAREIGYRKVTLWTNSILHAARRIYEARGFSLVVEEQHHSFGKDLTGQFWELRL